MKAYLLSLFVIAALLPEIHCEEFRTFTNNRGVQITARVVGILKESGSVKIQRQSDSQEFTIPVNTLTVADQEYIRQLLEEQANAPEPSDTVLVEVDGVDPILAPYTVDGPGMNLGQLQDYKVTHSLYRIPVAKGGWLHFKDRYPSNLNVAIPYLGESRLKLTIDDDGSVWVDRGAGRKLAAAKAPDEDFRNVQQWMRKIEPSTTDVVLNLYSDTTNPRWISAIEKIDRDIPIFLSAAPMTVSSYLFESLKKLKLKGLMCRISIVSIGDLKELESLEYLNITFRTSGDASTVIPVMPNLKHLVVRDDTSFIDFQNSLPNLPALETLVCRDIRKQANPQPPISSFTSNPNLKTLSFEGSGNFLVTKEALTTAPQLQYLQLAQTNMEEPIDAATLSALKNLRMYFVFDDRISKTDIDQWLADGNGKNISDFFAHTVPQCENLPKLESLGIYKTSVNDRTYDYSRISGAPPTLSRLYFENLGDSSLAKVKVPYPDKIESLHTFFSYFDTAKPLYQFPNLKRLVIEKNSQVTMMEIDAGAFPQLSILTLWDLPYLQKINFTTATNSIEALVVREAGSFNSPGPSGNYRKVQLLHLYTLPILKNLDSFDEVSRCRYLQLSDLDSLTSYEKFESKNDLKSILVSGCQSLDSRSEP